MDAPEKGFGNTKKSRFTYKWISLLALSLLVMPVGALLVQKELLGRQEPKRSSSVKSGDAIRTIADSLRKLSGNEAEVLSIVLSDPTWQEERPGDAELIQLLSTIAAKKNDPEVVQLLLSSLENDAGQPVWKKVAVLKGFEEALSDVPNIVTPEALAELSQSSHPEIKEHASIIRDRLQGSGTPLETGTSVQPLTSEQQQRFEMGEQEFKAICAGCHLENGQGMAEFAPPLVNSTWVQGPPKFLAMIVLQGKEGSPGYPPMPPLRGLNDERIAAILTYIRREWGHHASPVDPKLVAEVRKVTADRGHAWRERELEKLLKEGSDR